MSKSDQTRYLNRELSWLSFNGRVLQEAVDQNLPPYDRLTFLAIFSSNLDEFYRVRVAGLRAVLRLKKKKRSSLGFRPRRLLRQIARIVHEQQELFGRTLRGQILPELARNQVRLLDEGQLSEEQREFLDGYFRSEVEPHLRVERISDRGDIPFLRDRGLYLVAEVWQSGTGPVTSERPEYALVELPTDRVGRFLTLPGEGLNVMFLDDVVRHGLPTLFPEEELGEAYAVKLSRDADLYLEDEFAGSLVENIRKSLKKRETGLPSRFLYDLQAPYGLVAYLKERLGLDEEDLVPGGRYHNLHQLADFPRPEGSDLARPRLGTLAHPELSGADSILTAMRGRDQILHFPYQDYGSVIRFLEEAAEDELVEEIWITLYRVADDSQVVRALIRAAERGIRVRAFVEVKARFDEALNLRWASAMEEAGVETFYDKPGLKVHCKLALVARREEGEQTLYAYLATGNFNERTAHFYADHGLLTTDERLTVDVRQVFAYLTGEIEEPTFGHLLVAPFNLRSGFQELIGQEAARDDGRGSLTLKMNSLEDPGMIEALYDASAAGVGIDLIVRGICCARPGLQGVSENIRARSIVDRYLEHARVYLFGNRDSGALYLASADWMTRNLDRRVEVAFPIFDANVREQLLVMLDLQLADTLKARILDADQVNRYADGAVTGAVASQEDIRRYLGGLKSREG